MATNKTSKLEDLKSSEEFSTFDLGLTSALVSLNYEICALDDSNKQKVKFIFKKTDDGLLQAINDYWSNRLTLPAQVYFNNIKNVKNRIYQ